MIFMQNENMAHQYGIFIVMGFAAIAFMLSRQAIGNGIYIMTTHWRESAFLLLCALAGAGFAVKKDTIGRDLSYFVAGLGAPSEENAAAAVGVCKKFVQAKSAGLPFAPPRESRLFPASEDSYWETCARTFGMNYWKHDIAVGGRNGGEALCAAYARDPRATALPSAGKVEAWCGTVFATRGSGSKG